MDFISADTFAVVLAMRLKPPKYAHISPIMKEENGGKRKLSKRKDPEAAVSYYSEVGYPKGAIWEYLMTLANSNYGRLASCKS